MSEIKLKPCPLCGRSDIKTETWASGGRMYMVKCNNPDCPGNLEEVKAEWNRKAGSNEKD